MSASDSQLGSFDSFRGAGGLLNLNNHSKSKRLGRFKVSHIDHRPAGSSRVAALHALRNPSWRLAPASRERYGGECIISMGDTAARLVHSGYAVYGIDHEGHGKSTGSKGYISNFSDIVKDCSNYFKSVCEKPTNRSKKRFLYGFSMGGTVVLQLHRRDPLYWDGAVLLAPMCKISDDMRPPSFVVSALKMISSVAPSWRVITAPDMLDRVCKNPQFKKEIRSNPYMYTGKLALQTGRELLTVSLDIEKNLQEVSLPFLVLHGEDDIVAHPSGSKLLHERASSRDKTLKLYSGMWHVLMGERPEDVERVFADVISWLETRAGAAWQ
ncbi:hypothetical protein PR202_gb04286 [Eleusine coracana subsp. coracana]|uniref:Serine aminopeptidase S33 domain-containing protein n=1 Tax=Eleusine coracana subsp. coracana TaxID=191504 RepID=A0AAV5E457_ELECO|nr:hypothetical protein PR202_gb04286 [Eleusine coracana subsp. coracana]